MALSLRITNADGTVDITGLVDEITWEGDYKQCARSLEFGLISSPVDKQAPVVKCDLGNAVTLLNDGVLLFSGYVFSRDRATDGNVIDVHCKDRGFYMAKNKASYKFKNAYPQAITSQVCKDFGIRVGSVATASTKITRNFLGCTLYDIVMTAYSLAAEQTGKRYIARFEADALCVREKIANEETVIIEGGSNLMDATVSESVENMVNSVAIYNKDDKLVTTIKDDNAIRLYGLMRSYVKQAEKDKGDALKKAQKMIEDGKLEQKITVNTLGDISCTTGNTVILKEPYTGLYGLFWIDADTHTWKNRQYYNKLTLNFRNMMDEKEVGTVVEEKNKKKKK